jgi:ABC-type transporter Mla maintaining outer membrane lipid asymmetry permease subunit MlaE
MIWRIFHGRLNRFCASCKAGAYIFSAATLTIRPPFRFGVLFKQMEFVGVNFLTVVAIAKIFTGMVFALHTFYGFRLFGRYSLVIHIKSRPQAAGLSGSNRHRAFYPAAHLSSDAK